MMMTKNKAKLFGVLGALVLSVENRRLDILGQL